MKRKIDRRAVIFFVFAAIAALLLVPCPEKFRGLGITLAIVYLLLGLGSLFDARNRRRPRKRT